MRIASLIGLAGLLVAGCSNNLSGSPDAMVSDIVVADDTGSSSVEDTPLESLDLWDAAEQGDQTGAPDIDHQDLSAAMDAFDVTSAPDDMQTTQDIALTDDLGGQLDVPNDVATPGVDVEYMMANWPLGSIYSTTDGGFRGTFDSPSGTLGFLALTGSHREMGYQHGYLTAELVAPLWDQFFGEFAGYIDELAESIGITEEEAIPLLQSIISMVWDHMQPFMSQDFLDEIDGFAQGAEATGIFIDEWDWEVAAKALLVLSNISDLNWDGTFQDALDKLTYGMSPMLTDYYKSPELAEVMRALRTGRAQCRARPAFANSCSFFGAWGTQTTNGHYLGSRNLDWGTDTGIAALAGLVFYFPDNGISHVAIGYLGFIGSLAGMNSAGLVLSEVGSESEMERLKGEPWGFKFRRILEHADSLDGALQMALGLEEGGPPRPTTIGYNFAIGYGDPTGDGAGACGAVLETNGLRASVFAHAADCSVKAFTYDYDPDGNVLATLTPQTNPELVHLESQAVEVNALGEPRLFEVDGNGDFVMEGALPISADEGQPYPVGLVLPCAYYRGDEALMHANRMWQRASNGPQSGDRLLVSSGSYINRYKFSHDAIKAIREGLALGDWVPDNNGVPRTIGLDEGEWVAAGSAMGSNVMTIVYDATALAIRLSFEKGSGESWENAVAHPYIHVSIGEIFDLARMAN